MNKRDTEIVKDVLLDGDFVFTDNEKNADIILYNTCSVRKHAEDRVIGKMGQLSKQKLAESPKSYPEGKSQISYGASVLSSKSKIEDQKPKAANRPILGIIGCMAKIHGKKLFRTIPGLDLICSPSNIYDLKQDLEKVIARNIKLADIEERNYLVPKYKHIDKRDSSVCAWVSIIEGCENFCSYCVVPYARGKEISRPADEIIEEINELVERGFREVTLLGQNVNSYKLQAVRYKIQDTRYKTKEKRLDFIELLERINEETGIRRIRFMTNHPKDTSVELFEAMRDLDKVCPHLHLPLQSGSDRILGLMNRGYTVRKYKMLVDKLKSVYPECSLTTDIIVGFPGESDEDFMKTYKIMEEIKFDSAYIFKYSSRPGTKAAELEDDVPLEVKKGKNQKLLELQGKISYNKNKRYIGNFVNVLVENQTEKNIYLDKNVDNSKFKKYIGRTPDNKLVLFKGDRGLVGEEVEVEILKVTAHSLLGITYR